MATPIMFDRCKMIGILEIAHVDWKEHEARHAAEKRKVSARQCRENADFIDRLVRALKLGLPVSFKG